MDLLASLLSDRRKELLAAKILKEFVDIGQEVAKTNAILVGALETVGNMKANKESYDKAKKIDNPTGRVRNTIRKKENMGRYYKMEILRPFLMVTGNV